MADPPSLPVFNLGVAGVNVVRTPHHLEDGMLRLAQNAEPKTDRGRQGIGKRFGIGGFTAALGDQLLALASIALVQSAEAPSDPDSGQPQTNGDLGPAALTAMRTKAYTSSATTSITNNTETAVSFDSEVFDVGALHDPSSNPSRFTVPTGGDGLYVVIGQARWTGNGTGIRSARIYKNGTSLQAQNDAASGTTDFTRLEVAALINLVAGDYVELKVLQTSGGALNLLGTTESDTYLILMRLLSTANTTLPRCQAIRTTNQTITNGSATAIVLDGETFDTATMHDTSSNQSRITIPSGQDGLYAVIGQFAWAPALVGPYRVALRKNGTTELAVVRSSGVNDAAQDATGQCAVLATFVATDYVELVVTHNQVGGGTHDILGGGLNTTNLQVARVG